MTTPQPKQANTGRCHVTCGKPNTEPMGALTPKNSVESSRNSGNTTMTSSFATVLEEALPPGEKTDLTAAGDISSTLWEFVT